MAYVRPMPLENFQSTVAMAVSIALLIDTKCLPGNL